MKGSEAVAEFGKEGGSGGVLGLGYNLAVSGRFLNSCPGSFLH